GFETHPGHEGEVVGRTHRRKRDGRPSRRPFAKKKQKDPNSVVPTEDHPTRSRAVASVKRTGAKSRVPAHIKKTFIFPEYELSRRWPATNSVTPSLQNSICSTNPLRPWKV